MGGPFNAQSADLHTLWGVKTQGKKMRDLGSLTISDEGFPVWVRRRHEFSLAQFRDNVLIASSLSPGTHTTLVQDISSLLSHIWQLEVLCDCISEETPTCSRACLSSEIRAVGFTLVMGGGSGMAAVHPSSVKQDWSLRYGLPVKSPEASERTYRSCIFSGALTTGLPWCVTWGSQILSALAWVQLALQCGYPRHTALRAMHTSARRVFSASPCCSENTMRAVFAVSHHMPAPRHLVVQKLARWLLVPVHIGPWFVGFSHKLCVCVCVCVGDR